MTAIEALLNQPGAQAIGWALVHFAWQGTLVAACAAVLLAALHRSAADVRYVVATIGLTLMATMPAVTAVQAWRAAHGPGLLPGTPAWADTSSATEALERGAVSESPSSLLSVPEATADQLPIIDRAVARIRLERWIPAMLMVWLSGVALLTLRLAAGWIWVQRTRSHEAAAAAGWEEMASRLSRRLRIPRPVRLLQSTLVDVPTVAGWLKPVVLLPASALAGLSPHQMEAILAHELAHIRRHDYLVNLLQTLVETLLFYHPAVWWLSRRIRTERELCCDDLAVRLCGDPLTYASALAELEARRGGGRELVLAANGGSLVHRVRRVLGAPSHAGRGPGWLAGSIAILLMFGVAAGAVGNGALPPHDDQETSMPPAARVERADAAGPVDEAVTAGAIRAVGARAATATSAPIARAGSAIPVGTRAVAATVEAVRATVATAQDSVRSDRGRRRGNFVWSNNGEKIELSYDGEVEFTGDDTDVKSLSPGGYLKISDGGWFGGRGVEFRADATGAITRRFRVGIVEKPFEPDGRAWLARTLPRFIRQSGIGAPARVARILEAKGPAGVLAEIAQIEGSYGKRVYFAELFKTASLDAATVRLALAQASREIQSDYELASLLIASQHLITDDASRKAYFDASSTIQSDYELGRVLSAGLKAGRVTPAVLAGILGVSSSIESDYELASLLVQIAKLQPLDATTRRPFFTALDGVGGAYEHGRVLSALAARTDLSSETLVAMLQSGGRLRSDYEQAQFLLHVAKAHAIDATLRGPFFAAADRVSSSFEKGRVLQAVVKRTDTDADTVLAVLRSAATISGNYERSQVLLAAAESHTISGAARDAYIEAAEKLGEYEQGRVLAALVRSERKK